MGQVDAVTHPADHASHAVDHRQCAFLNTLHGEVDFPNGTGGALGQQSNLVGYHGKPAPRLAGPCGLDGGVQRQEVGLLGNAANHLEHMADLPGEPFELANVHGRSADHVADAVHLLGHVTNKALALARTLCRMLGDVARHANLIVHFANRPRQVLNRPGNPAHRVRLLLGGRGGRLRRFGHVRRFATDPLHQFAHL
ncbi:hypothetical protein D3C76_1266360 [compost metagenome]